MKIKNAPFGCVQTEDKVHGLSVDFSLQSAFKSAQILGFVV